MTGQFSTDNISHLTAIPLDAPAMWQIQFQSADAGRCHQLYVNGVLTDWTDSPAVRHFDLECDGPAELCVSAVQPECRTTDFGWLLPQANRQPAWIWRGRVIRQICHRPGDILKVYTDHATGQLDDRPVITRNIWPDWTTRWVWGEDFFGLGGFGWDGFAAPGLQRGAFGAASFGMDAELIELQLVLAEPGEHKILLRTAGSDGQTADAPIIIVNSDSPPPPPQSVAVTQYDPQTETLTFVID